MFYSAFTIISYIAPGQITIKLIDVFITHNGKYFPIMRYEYIHQLNRKLLFNDVTYDIESTIYVFYQAFYNMQEFSRDVQSINSQILLITLVLRSRVINKINACSWSTREMERTVWSCNYTKGSNISSDTKCSILYFTPFTNCLNKFP